MDVEDPKNVRAIAGTLKNFQIPVLTYRGHCNIGTAAPSGNDATSSLVLHTNLEEENDHDLVILMF